MSDFVGEQQEKPWSVYMLRCGDGSLYCGATNDIAARVAAHGMGRGGAYTRSHLPVELVYSEACGSRGDALRREIAIKRLTREEKEGLVGIGSQ